MEIFAMGAISGITGVIHSYPIDTIKTNIQKHCVIDHCRIIIKVQFYGTGLARTKYFEIYKLQNC